ncbi:MAG: HYR domain-containing protein, partial [Bacteroidota bacterium]
MLLLAAGPSLFGQLPFTEDFSDDNLEGARGPCSNSTPGSCTYIAPTDWSLSGDFSSLGNNDYFYVYFYNGEYILEGSDTDREVCYNSPVLTATNSTVELSVDVEQFNGDNTDYIEINLIVDGTSQQIAYLNGNFVAQTVTSSPISVTNNVQIQICVFNNRNNEFHWFKNISLTASVSCNDPVANCQNITRQLDGSGNVSIAASDIDNGSTYACGLSSMSVNPNAFDCTQVGDNNVVLTVTDVNGRTATCNATVTIEDATAPTISDCPSNITTNADASSCEATVNYTAPTSASDNCPYQVSGFTGDYAPGNWTYVTNGDGQVVTSGAPDSVVLYGPDDGNWYTQSNMTTTITQNGTISFNWSYRSEDLDAAAGFDPAGIIYNGVYYQLTSGTSWFFNGVLYADGNTVQSGSVSFNVNAGDSFGFYQYTIDAVEGSGIFRIENFNAPGNIPSPTLSSGLASGSNFPIGTSTVVYSVTDASGNTGTCSFTVTVNDNQDPVITSCASNQTVNTNSGTCAGTVPNLTGSIAATDNCAVASITQSPVAGSTFGSSDGDTQVVTFTVTDDGGRTATCSATLTLVDNQGPSITSCASNQNVNMGSGTCQGTVPDLTGSISDSDNCATSITQSPTAGSTFGSSDGDTQVVTFTVSDGNNSTTCTATLTLVDNQSPSITTCVSNQNVNMGSGTCQGTVPDLTGSISASDNCATTITQSPTAGSTFGSSDGDTQVVTFTVSDGNNSTTCTATLTLVDNQSPSITTCASNQNVNTGSGTCQGTVPDLTGSVSVSDNCATSVTQSPTAGSTFGSAHGDTQVVTFTVSDGTNSSSCTATLTLVDNQSPSITACASDQTINMSTSSCQGTVPDMTGSISASDNCTTGVTQSPTAGSAFGSASGDTEVVTFTVTDGGGNASTCTAVLTLVDNAAPSISCPSNVSASNDAGVCEANLTLTPPSPTDNCGSSSTLTFNASQNYVSIPNFNYNGSYPAMTVETWINTTDGTDQVIASFDRSDYWRLEVNGNAAPANKIGFGIRTNSGMVNLTSTTDVNDGQWHHVAAVYDNGAVSLYVDGILEDSANRGTTFGRGSVRYGFVGIGSEATAENGNRGPTWGFNGEMADLRVWSVARTTAQIAQNINYLSGSTAGLEIWYQFGDGTGSSTVADNSGNGNDGTLYNIDPSTSWGTDVIPLIPYNSFNNTTDASDAYPVGTTTINWVATDAAGNSATCSQVVTVTDDEAPSVSSCASNQTVNMNGGTCAGTVPDLTGSISATDNCGGSVSVTQSPTAGSTFGSADGDTQVVTFTVSDGTNSTTCTATLTLNDNVSPSISTCPSDQNVNINGGTCAGTVPDMTGSVSATDNCGGSLSVTQSPTVGSTFGAADGDTQVVTFTVSDGTNSTTCTATLTLVDNEAPSITACATNQTVNTGTSNCQGIVPDLTGSVNATDNCGSTTITQSPTAGSTFGSSVGDTQVVTFTVSDGTNSTSCTATLTLADNQAPAITACASDQNVNMNSSSCQGTVPDLTGDITASDNCGSVSVTQSPTAGSSFGSAHNDTQVVTFTVSDGTNTSTCTATLTLVDNQGPSLSSCPSNITQNASTGDCFTSVSWSAPSASDNCNVTLVSNYAPGDNFPVGTSTVLYTATDDNGNTATCSFTITINDQEAPTLSCPSDIVVNTDSGSCTAAVSYTLPTASDNCPVGSLSIGVFEDFESGNRDTERDSCWQFIGSTVNASSAIAGTYSMRTSNLFPPSERVAISPFIYLYGSGQLTFQHRITGNPNTDTLKVDLIDSVGNMTRIYTHAYQNTSIQSEQISISNAGYYQIRFGFATGQQSGRRGVLDQVSIPGILAVDVTNSPGSGACAPISMSTTQIDGTSLSSGDDFPVGQTILIYRATDASGNSSSCSFTITVNDNEAPVITACASDQNINMDASDCQGTVPDLTSSIAATDNCGSTTVTQSPAANSTFGSTDGDTQVVTFTVSDGTNSTTCTATLTLVDNQTPSITACASDQNINMDASSCEGTVPDLTSSITTTDNCGSPTVTQSPAANSTFGSADGDTQVVTFTVSDGTNTTTCSATLTLVDNQDPSLSSCPSNITQNTSAGDCYASVSWSAPTASDNCNVTLVSNYAPGDNFPIGTSTVLYTATDDSGNTATCSFTVTI